MSDSQVEQGALIVASKFASGGNAKVEQGIILAAVSFTPPQTISTVEQGALLIAVRRYEKLAFATMGPPTDINQSAPYNEIPYPWRA